MNDSQYYAEISKKLSKGDIKYPIKLSLIATTFHLEGYKIIAHKGLVRGIMVRSLSAIGSFGASIETFFWW